MEVKTCRIFIIQGNSLEMNVFNESFSVSVYTCVSAQWSNGPLVFYTLTTMYVASGKDVADEHVYHHSAGVHCGSVGSEVHCGLPGIPLRPHHDSAAAPPHPLKDL